MYAYMVYIYCMRITKNTKTCPKCNGTGKIIDPCIVGPVLRLKRISTSISLRTMAKRIGISAMYLSEMERGLKAWSGERIQQFLNELAK